MFLKEISKICIKPLRIAFDHIGLKKPYEQAIRYSADAGLMELSNYMLYNFHDTPEDLYERMRLNIDLNQELGTKIFSFPMRYQPTDRQDRGFVGDHWNKYYLRSFQIILQATHGIVSGAPDFFKRAFGDNANEFKELLMMPQHFIFNRDWYEEKDGKAELEQYKKDINSLSSNEKKELLQIVSNNKPIQIKKAIGKQPNKKLSSVLNHYIPLSDEASEIIWKKQKKERGQELIRKPNDIVPDEERVEDAGLEVA